MGKLLQPYSLINVCLFYSQNLMPIIPNNYDYLKIDGTKLFSGYSIAAADQSLKS